MNKKSLYIILSLLIFFIFFELVFRQIEGNVSKDSVHYHQMDSIIARLEEPSNNNLLFIGNSLTRHGIDADILSTIISESKIGIIRPDDTTINEWYWLFESKITRTKPVINTLVIPFAPGQLSDSIITSEKIIKLSKIAHIEDLLQVNKFESLDFGQTFEFLLSHSSLLYASREKIQRRILDALPYYRLSIRKINESMQTQEVLEHTEKHYKHLKSLIEQRYYPELKIVFVAVPLPSKYTIDNKILRLFKSYSHVYFIDGNLLDEIKQDDFLDGYHLNEVGAKKFTKFIVDNLPKK